MKEYRFTAAEIKDLVRKMIILVDSREKRNQHILAYFEKQGIPYQVTKLDFGDYSFLLPASAAGIDLYFHQDICIERKATLEELSGNLAQKRQLFEMEFLKAGNNGAKVYLMVEHPGGYTDIINHAYKTELSPVAFMASLKTWESRFGCNVQFIDNQYSGYFIVSTFQYYAREKLK